jgi:hypothetical protein
MQAAVLLVIFSIWFRCCLWYKHVRRLTGTWSDKDLDEALDLSMELLT